MRELTNNEVAVLIVFVLLLTGAVAYYFGIVKGTQIGIDYMNDYINKSCTCLKGLKW